MLIDLLSILLDFGLQLGGQERTRELTFGDLIEVLLALGPRWPPDPSKGASGTDLGAILVDFSSIVYDFG